MLSDLSQTATVRFTIRPMTLDDLEQVVALDQVSFSLPWPAHSFRYELLDNEFSRLWVAETVPAESEALPSSVVPRVIGMIVVWLIIDEAHIATLAVHPQHRRRGVGRQLLLTALQGCATQGAVSAKLEVRERNEIAINMYRELSFEVVGRRKRYYQDTNEDAILMTLENLTSLAG
jgi:ribosomal-protein-alanine N-acetyltransferase